MKNRFHIFTTLPFILCLGLLIANDFYWKYAFHNALTGKLSDFTGLFLFPIFWSAMFSKWQKWVYWGTGLFFIFWKSPAADGFIKWWNAWCFWGISRVVDFSDCWALLSLPLAYWYEDYWRGGGKLLEVKVHPTLMAIVSFWAFAATSPPPPKWQDFERPMTFVYQLDTIALCEFRECCEMVKERNLQYQEYPPPSFDDYFIIDSLLIFQSKGAFIDQSFRTFIADTTEEKRGKVSLILQQHSDYPCGDCYGTPLSHCLDFSPHFIVDTLEVEVTLSDERQELRFTHSIQDGKQTYFHKNGKPRLIAHYKGGLEEGNWRYFSENEELFKEEIYETGILKKTNFYKNGQLKRTKSTASIFTLRNISSFLWAVYLVLMIYTTYSLRKASVSKKVKWIFPEKGWIIIIFTIIIQSFLAILIVGIVVIFSGILHGIISTFYYQYFGFQTGLDSEFPRTYVYAFLIFLIPVFMYMLLEHTRKEWTRWFFLLIACNLLLFQSLLFLRIGF